MDRIDTRQQQWHMALERKYYESSDTLGKLLVWFE